MPQFMGQRPSQQAAAARNSNPQQQTYNRGQQQQQQYAAQGNAANLPDDIEDMSNVFNEDMYENLETYVDDDDM
jgi:hypothetical protein